MYRSFDEIIDKAKAGTAVRISVAGAEDVEILKALAATAQMGLTSALLFGNKQKVQQLLQEHNIIATFEIEDADEQHAVEGAVLAVRNGQAQVLMKGLVNSSTFMKQVLNREAGLRTDRVISHMACYELPGYGKLLFCTDSGINVAPDLSRKKDILRNALGALSDMGYAQPRVALLAANEQIDPKIQATVDAAELMNDYRSGFFGDCIMEGPVAFDVAFSPEAAKHKGISSRVSGEVDVLLCPAIEVGNVLGKSWLHFNHAKWAGLVLGAVAPILMGSRSDSFEVKVNAIALACLMSSIEQSGGR